jgi:hypothetical protein
MAPVSEPAPTAREARTALAVASGHAARLRQADHHFKWILLGLAGAYLLLGGVVSASPPQAGATFAALAFLVIMGGAVLGTAFVIWRIRAYSSAGMRWFSISCSAFTFWNAIVCGVSSFSGWWGPRQPSHHFGISAAVGVIPLAVAAWLIGRR